MTTDLTMLVAAALLSLLSAVPYVTARVAWSLTWAAGNRDTTPQDRPWVGRSERAHRNLLESLPAFAALVLVAHVSGRANHLTALGASLFVYARVAYLAVYLIGIPWLRTACWCAAVTGMAIIAIQLF